MVAFPPGDPDANLGGELDCGYGAAIDLPAALYATLGQRPTDGRSIGGRRFVRYGLRYPSRTVPTSLELAELRLADALDALYAAKDDFDAGTGSGPVPDPRALSLAITKAEESALWLGASRSRESLPAALRRLGLRIGVT